MACSNIEIISLFTLRRFALACNFIFSYISSGIFLTVIVTIFTSWFHFGTIMQCLETFVKYEFYGFLREYNYINGSDQRRENDIIILEAQRRGRVTCFAGKTSFR